MNDNDPITGYDVMTDIVERLRGCIRRAGYAMTIANVETIEEAADEIERLRVENKRLRGWIAPDILELTDEIERLTAALQAMMDGEPNAAQLAARALEPKP